MEEDFLTSRNSILLLKFMKIRGSNFFLLETDFLANGNRFLLFDFFLQMEIVTVISGNPFFREVFNPTSRKESFVQWKLFSFIP